MDADEKTVQAEEVKPEAGESSSDSQAEGAEESAQKDSQYIPKARFDQVNERMKQAEDYRRQQEYELAKLRAEMDVLRGSQKLEDDFDPVKEYEGNPEGFVQHFTDKVKREVEAKLGKIEGENKNLRFQLQVQEAASRLEDFDEYREDIITLIKDPHYQAINPEAPGAIDLYYLAARDRRAASKRSQNVAATAPKVPHTESSRRRTRPIAKDPRDMSLDELRAHIGESER